MFKKKKIVLTSVLALAGVSLATVGFATWIVGLNKPEESLTVKALVDNSLNQSIYLEAVTDGKNVEIAETEAYTTLKDNEIVKTQDGGPVSISNEALQFTFTTLQYSVGKDVTSEKMPNHISFELLTTDECNIVKTANCKMDTNYRAKATEDASKNSQYHYLQFKEEFALISEEEGKTVTLDTSVSADKSFKTYKVDKLTYTLSWGDFFESAGSPREFYNAKSVAKINALSDKAQTKSELFKDAGNANLELQKMKDALDVGTLTVKVSLSHK